MASQDLNEFAFPPVPEEEFEEPLSLTQPGFRKRDRDEAGPSGPAESTEPTERRVLPTVEEEQPEPPRAWFPLLETNSRALVIVLERGRATGGHPEEMYEGRFRGGYDGVQIQRVTDTRNLQLYIQGRLLPLSRNHRENFLVHVTRQIQEFFDIMDRDERIV